MGSESAFTALTAVKGDVVLECCGEVRGLNSLVEVGGMLKATEVDHFSGFHSLERVGGIQLDVEHTVLSIRLTNLREVRALLLLFLDVGCCCCGTPRLTSCAYSQMSTRTHMYTHSHACPIHNTAHNAQRSLSHSHRFVQAYPSATPSDYVSSCSAVKRRP